jgi:DNA polymerase elongation subunit (family B)/intein/homing endonuclease
MGGFHDDLDSDRDFSDQEGWGNGMYDSDSGPESDNDVDDDLVPTSVVFDDAKDEDDSHQEEESEYTGLNVRLDADDEADPEVDGEGVWNGDHLMDEDNARASELDGLYSGDEDDDDEDDDGMVAPLFGEIGHSVWPSPSTLDATDADESKKSDGDSAPAPKRRKLAKVANGEKDKENEKKSRKGKALTPIQVAMRILHQEHEVFRLQADQLGTDHDGFEAMNKGMAVEGVILDPKKAAFEAKKILRVKRAKEEDDKASLKRMRDMNDNQLRDWNAQDAIRSGGQGTYVPGKRWHTPKAPKSWMSGQANVHCMLLAVDQQSSKAMPIDLEHGDTATNVPILRLTCGNHYGNTAIVYVHGFKPYLYVRVPDDLRDQDMDLVANDLRSSLDKVIETHPNGRKKDGPYVLKAEDTRKLSMMGWKDRNFLEPWIKVTLALPQYIGICRDALFSDPLFAPEDGKSWNQGVTWCGKRRTLGTEQLAECNIPFPLRFLIDANMRGQSWFTMPSGSYDVLHGKQTRTLSPFECRVHYTDLQVHEPVGEWADMGKLRILSFDVETSCDQGRGKSLPKPERSNDQLISVAYTLAEVTNKDWGKPWPQIVFTWKTCAPIKGVEVVVCQDEKDTILSAARFMRVVQAQYLTGYNLSYDLPWFTVRAQTLNIQHAMFLGPILEPSEVKIKFFESKAFGKVRRDELNVPGSVVFDVLTWIRREDKRESYTLNAVAFDVLGMTKADVHHCVRGDTQISLADGSSCRIDELIHHRRKLFSLRNETDASPTVTVSNQTDWFDQGEKDCVELEFEDGRKLVCTGDHQVWALTTASDGTKTWKWVSAEELQIGTSRVATSVEAPLTSFQTSDDKWTRSFGPIKLSMNTVESRQKTYAFARLCGWVITDGHLTKQRRVSGIPGSVIAMLFLGHQLDCETVLDDIELLIGSRPSVSFDEQSYTVVIPNSLSQAFASVSGMVFGHRTTQAHSLPQFVLEADCPVTVVREFVAAMFGGDGTTPCISTNGKSKGLRGVTFTRSAVSDHVDSLQTFLSQVVSLLSRVGVTQAKVNGPSKTNKPDVLTYHIDLAEKALVTFYERVGFRYCAHKTLRLAAAATYKRVHRKIVEQNLRVHQRVHELSGYSEAKTKVLQANPNLSGTQLNSAMRKHMKMSLEKARLKAVDEIRRSEFILHPHCSIPSIATISQRLCKGIEPGRWKQSDFSFVQWFEEAGAIDMFMDPSTDSATVPPVPAAVSKKRKYALPRSMHAMPTFSLKLVSRRAVGRHRVYDISVEDTHSFVANGLVIHNSKIGPMFHGVPAVQDEHGTILVPARPTTDEDRARLLYYNVKDTLLPLLLMEKRLCLTLDSETCRVTGVTIPILLAQGQTVKIESYMMRDLPKENLLQPYIGPKKMTGAKFEGALVVEPKKGYYAFPVATADFASLYPSIMQSINLCYVTYLKPGTHRKLPRHDYIQVPSVPLLKGRREESRREDEYDRFVRGRRQTGELPKVLTRFITQRKIAKKDMAKYEEEGDKFMESVMDKRQLALKVGCNSVYGFPGGSKMQLRQLCRVVTFYARALNRFTQYLVKIEFPRWLEEQHNLWENTGSTKDEPLRPLPKGLPDIIYGDTDSVMVIFGDMKPELAFRYGPVMTEFCNQFYKYFCYLNDHLSEQEAIAWERGVTPRWRWAENAIRMKWADELKGKDREQKQVFERMLYQGDVSVSSVTVKIEFEKIYANYLLMGKKRYFGRKCEKGPWDPYKLDGKGLESQRRDTCKVTRRLIKTTANLICGKGMDPPSIRWAILKTMSKRNPDAARAAGEEARQEGELTAAAMEKIQEHRLAQWKKLLERETEKEEGADTEEIARLRVLIEDPESRPPVMPITEEEEQKVLQKPAKGPPLDPALGPLRRSMLERVEQAWAASGMGVTIDTFCWEWVHRHQYDKACRLFHLARALGMLPDGVVTPPAAPTWNKQASLASFVTGFKARQPKERDLMINVKKKQLSEKREEQQAELNCTDSPTDAVLPSALAALEYCKQNIVSLLKGTTDLSELVMSQSLSKSLKDYPGKLAHVELAKRMARRDPGSAPREGDRVPYVVLCSYKGAQKSVRVENPLYAIEHDLPLDYVFYYENMVRKPLRRVFNIAMDFRWTRQLDDPLKNRAIIQVSSKTSGIGKHGIVGGSRPLLSLPPL